MRTIAEATIPRNWRICFFVPAGIALVVAAALMLWLRDTPESVGLPEIEGTHVAAAVTEAAQSPAEYRSFLWERVFSDKYIWIVSAANFFVYVLRYAIFDWGAVMLKEVKGIEVCTTPRGWWPASNSPACCGILSPAG